LAAQSQLKLAQWICLRFKASPLVSISPEQELEWSKKAAHVGLRPITLDLATFDPEAAQSCHEAYQRSFWALAYDVADDTISAITQLEENVAGSSQILDSLPSSPFGNTPLHVAALIGKLGSLVVMAKSQLIDVNATNHRGETPLFLACRCGHAAVVDFLLSLGADAGIPNKYGASCLHWLDAFEEHDIARIAQSLVRHGNDPNQPARQDHSCFGDKSKLFHNSTVAGTPLHRQVVGGSVTAIKALLSLGSKSDFIVNDWTPIDRAAQFHRSEIVEILLDKAPSFDLNSPAPKSGLAPLHRAMMGVDPFLAIYNHSGNHEGALEATLDVLMARGTLPSELKTNPILYAVSKGAHSALEFLIKYQNKSVSESSCGIDLGRQLRLPKPRGNALLDRMFRVSHRAIESRSKTGQADIGGRQVEGDPFTYNAVLEAVKYEDEEILKTLLRYGADPLSLLHFRKHTRFNALHLCATHMHGGTQIAQLLIDHGVHVNQSASALSSDTPLCYALQGNQFHLASLFLDNGASLTVCEKDAERGNVMGELTYCIPGRSVFNALQFLAQHPTTRSDMPLYIHDGYKTTVFHMICGLSELRRRKWPAADFFPVFALLRKIFPETSFLDAADISGFTPLHYAIYHAFPEAVQALLEAGADPFSQVEPDLSNPLIDSEWITKPGTAYGISILALVESEGFIKIHSGINDADRHEFVQRRERIKELFSPYTF
jgi:ankyrin repeat protein